MSIELEIFRKKVYLDTVSSTQIQHSPNLLPQWITQNQINFVSAYQFCYYNVEDQHTHIIPRKQGQQQVISIQFKAELNQNNSTAHYIYRNQQNFYLVEQLDGRHQEVLVYQNNNDNRQFLVYQFLDYLMNEGEQLKSSKSIASRTQRIIQQIKQEEDKQSLKDSVHELKDIKQLLIVYQCGYALLLVEMKKKTGLMIININSCSKTDKKQFFCPIRPANYNEASHQLTLEQLSSPRIIYLFPDSVISLHRTKDITQFVLLTSRDILLIKIDYDQMQFHILDKKTCHKKQKFMSLSVSIQKQEVIILALCESSKPYETSIRQLKKKRLMKMFLIEQKQIKEVKQKRNQQNGLKYEFQIQKDIHFDEQNSTIVRSNVRFNENVLHSQYEIEDDKAQDKNVDDFNRGILMSVYNTIMEQQKTNEIEPIGLSDQNMNGQLNNQQINEPISKKQDHIIKDIAGFACNQKLVIIWQKNEPIIHICQVLGSHQQEQLEKNDKIEKKTIKIIQQQKQKQIKQVYSQLLGIPLTDCKDSGKLHHPMLVYVCKIQLQLVQLKINKIIISPNNSNLLIISGNDNQEHTEIVNFHIFQIDLFRQLGNQNSNIFIKTIKNIYKPKPTELIVTSLVKQSTFFLTGNSLHSLQCQLLDGVLSFDVHPYNVFFAVSFGFTTKIYAFQGSDKLTSLFTMNGQGMKQVKYSPLGNHLCILFSKSIKVLDSYNFMTKFTINEKSSNFIKCYFSSNGLELFTSSQNHHFSIYNTFDYTKVDTIKPNIPIHDFKPISIKSFLKVSQYCLVLESGSLYVRYKSNAVVVTPQQVYSYNDGQKITCIEIDEKNAILFTGCRSGLVRAHLWPNKDGVFECYSEIRTSFCEVSCLSLSHLSSTLFLGNQNGNISKLKYMIDRDKGNNRENDNNLLITDKNFRNFTFSGMNSVEKMYQYVLANSASTSQELPQKVKLQYKLSQVIQKLNDEMRKMKLDIRKELDERSKQNLQKVDFGLLYHLHQMIATKLYAQLREEIQFNQKQIRQLNQNNQEQFKKVIEQQVQLVKQKSFNTSDFIGFREKIKKEYQIQEEKQNNKFETEIKLIEDKVKKSQKVKELSQDQIYFISNNFVEQYLQQKNRLEKQLQYQNKRHFELRKECAYKQTAIKGLNAKTIKEESLQFKLQLQYSQMQKKLAYSSDIIEQFKNQILQAELKAHKVQIQSSIIKSYAQYQRVANVEQMIDACSYNIWLKNKIQKQIADLSDYLRKMEQFLDEKGNEIVDLISLSGKNDNDIHHLTVITKGQKLKLKNKRYTLLNLHNKLKKVDPINQYKSLRNSFEENKTQRKDLRQASRVGNHKNIKSVERKTTTEKSQRITRMNSKNIECIDTIIQKETKFIKSSIKIHHKKVNRLQKQNGQMLFQYQKLKFEQKNLKEKQIGHYNLLQKVQNQIECAKSKQFRQTTTKVQLSKTSFQKYLQLKSNKNTSRTKYKTAASSPLHSANTTILFS